MGRIIAKGGSRRRGGNGQRQSNSYRSRLRLKPREAAPCTPIPSRFMHVAASLISSATPPRHRCNHRNASELRDSMWFRSVLSKSIFLASVSYRGQDKDTREALTCLSTVENRMWIYTCSSDCRLLHCCKKRSANREKTIHESMPFVFQVPAAGILEVPSKAGATCGKNFERNPCDSRMC